MAKLILGNCVGVVDLVAEDDERYFRELLHREEGIQFGFRFGQTLVVFRIDEEDDAVNFGEVIFPESASCERLTISRLKVRRIGTKGNVPCW